MPDAVPVSFPLYSRLPDSPFLLPRFPFSVSSRKPCRRFPPPLFLTQNPVISLCISVFRRAGQPPQRQRKAQTKPPFPAGTIKNCPHKPPPNRRRQIPFLRGQAAIRVHRIWLTESPRGRHNKKAFYFPLTIYLCPFSGYMTFSFCFSWHQYIIKKRPCKNICVLQAKNFNKTFRKRGFTFATGLCILIEGCKSQFGNILYSDRYSDTDC